MPFLNKKFFTTFLGFFLLGCCLAPSFALADGTYQIQYFNDANTNGVFDRDSKNNPAEDIVEGQDGKPFVCYDGFVPCGKDLKIPSNLNQDRKCPVVDGGTNVPCQLCHFFIMIDNAVDYLVIKLVPILAVMMMVIAGIMFYFGGVRPELLSRAKTLIKGVVIGLALIYGAYIIVNGFLVVLGAAHANSVSQVFKNGIFSIECPVYVPKP